ncbi:MAG: carbamate kinase [Bacteroidetes bacterium]|nr:MAG: carbamate kinase [Bacteroidota bacterium]
MKKLAVVAFGGNALLRGDQKGTIDEQEENIFNACQDIVELIENGYDLVIGHGNGPQVGNVLLQHEAGFKIFGIPKMPMDICVAETQGSIGYMIEQQLHNVLLERGIKRNIITIITQVLVDKEDEAFKNPTKPVGPYYTEDEMEGMRARGDWKFKKDPAGRGWRRVVASPKPQSINNWEVVESLARQGHIVITVGGGGIPAYIQSNGKLMGIDAVIDKDLASATLASNIKADEFYILTDVSNVFINFNTPEQKKLEEVSIDEMQKHMADGQFTEGSMAPKVRAGIHFVENGGKQTVITDSSQLKNPNSGTRIVK